MKLIQLKPKTSVLNDEYQEMPLRIKTWALRVLYIKDKQAGVFYEESVPKKHVKQHDRNISLICRSSAVACF